MKTTILTMVVVFFSVASIADGATIVAVGVNGHISRSTDDGSNWSTINSGTTKSLTDVECHADGNCWIAGVDGTILRSTDGGINWSSLTSGVSSSFNAIEFVDSQTGWVVGTDAVVLHTVDGGNTWQQQPTSSPQGNGVQYTGVTFVDELRGWIVGSAGEARITVDGGANWGHHGTAANGNFTDIDFADANNGLIITDVSQVAQRTMNGGVNWTKSIIPGPGFVALDVEMVDNLTGWIVGRTGGVIRTDDGGVTWSQQSFDDGSWWPGISMLSDTTGWAVSSYGKVRYTTNGGLLWSPQFTGTLNHLESVSAFEPIPEPSTLTLAACALVGLAYARRKRRL